MAIVDLRSGVVEWVEVPEQLAFDGDGGLFASLRISGSWFELGYIHIEEKTFIGTDRVEGRFIRFNTRTGQLLSAARNFSDLVVYDYDPSNTSDPLTLVERLRLDGYHINAMAISADSRHVALATPRGNGGTTRSSTSTRATSTIPSESGRSARARQASPSRFSPTGSRPAVATG